MKVRKADADEHVQRCFDSIRETMCKQNKVELVCDGLLSHSRGPSNWTNYTNFQDIFFCENLILVQIEC